MRIDGNDVCALATAMTQPVVRQRHVERRREAPEEPPPPPPTPPPSPPRRDGGAPREIPSNGGGSDISRVVREFDIGEIGVVNDPATETGAAAAAAAVAAAGNRGGRQQSTTSGRTSFLHEIITV
jgi:hypothetical protein